MRPAHSDERLDPPTKLKNGWFARPFLMFVEMYGIRTMTGSIRCPSVGPDLFACCSGIMFGGSVGQGIVVILAGLLLSKWKRHEAGRSDDAHRHLLRDLRLCLWFPYSTRPCSTRSITLCWVDGSRSTSPAAFSCSLMIIVGISARAERSVWCSICVSGCAGKIWVNFSFLRAGGGYLLRRSCGRADEHHTEQIQHGTPTPATIVAAAEMKSLALTLIGLPSIPNKRDKHNRAMTRFEIRAGRIVEKMPMLDKTAGITPIFRTTKEE